MLTIFPHLLTYGFFAPTIIRVTLAGVFFYTAYRLSKHHKPAWWHVALHTIVGLMLFVGFYTQLAAALTALGSIIGIIFWHKLPHEHYDSRLILVLTLAMSLSLLLTGAGALAFDLPL